MIVKEMKIEIRIRKISVSLRRKENHGKRDKEKKELKEWY